jgi:uncharacterized cupin superfamily protein
VNLSLSVAEVELVADELDPDSVISGDPHVSSLELWASEDGTQSRGIWQITPGTVTDVELQEMFVVVSGRATIAIEDGPTLEVGPGDVGFLAAGARTTWTVHETLRKVYHVSHSVAP